MIQHIYFSEFNSTESAVYQKSLSVTILNYNNISRSFLSFSRYWNSYWDYYCWYINTVLDFSRIHTHTHLYIIHTHTYAYISWGNLNASIINLIFAFVARHFFSLYKQSCEVIIFSQQCKSVKSFLYSFSILF